MKPFIFEVFALSQSDAETVERKGNKIKKRKRKTEGKHGKEQGKIETDWLNNNRMRKEISMH